MRPSGFDRFLTGQDAGHAEPYKVTWADDLLACLPAQERGDYLVEGLLPAGELVILNARPKAGKGLLSIDLVCSIALGEPFLGQAVIQGPALYAAAEEHIGEIADRIRRRLGSGRSESHRVGVMDISGSGPRDLRLERREDLASLARSIQSGGFVVVVIDTLREVHGGHEDVADEMAPLLKPLRTLAHATGVTIILNHHQNKAGDSRGSTAIAGACDTIWSFQRPQGGSGPFGRALPPHGTLVVEGRRVPLQAVAIEFGEDGRWRRSSEAPARRASGTTSDAATEVMRVLSQEAGMTVKQIVEATRLGDSAVRAFLGGSSGPLPAGVSRVGSGAKNDPCRYLLETPA